METSLARLRQIADELRNLPDEYGGHASFVLQTGGALIAEAIDLGAFSGKKYAGFRAKIKNARIDAGQISPKSWRNWLFNVAVNHFRPGFGAPADEHLHACGWIADAMEAEIKRMEAERETSLPPNRPEDSSPEPTERSPFGFQPPDPRHSDDFTYVCWYKTEYKFTKTQAACVRVLWEAWEGKNPVLMEETILDKAGSEGRQLRDVFKSKIRTHAAWDTMIVSAGKGRFRLQEPEVPQAPERCKTP